MEVKLIMWFEGMEDMLKENNKADFTIHTKPYETSLICPHCNTEVHVDWNEIDEPECWDNDDWGSIYCPCCGKEVFLGNYDSIFDV